MRTLTDRFTHAVDYARIAHAHQTRKGSDIPYLYHLLGVASLVIEFGGSEDQVIAGLLHDVIEDCGAAHESAIRHQFGPAAAEIVVVCTDGCAEEKSEHAIPEAKRADWTLRKQRYTSRTSPTRTTTFCWCRVATSCTTRVRSCRTWRMRAWGWRFSSGSREAGTGRCGTTMR